MKNAGVSSICWIPVDDPTAVRAEVNASVDARITGDSGIGERVLVPIVVDAVPAQSGIVGSIDSPNPRNLRAAVQRRIFVERRGLAETNRAGRVDVREFEKGIAAVDRMPDDVHSRW